MPFDSDDDIEIIDVDLANPSKESHAILNTPPSLRRNSIYLSSSPTKIIASDQAVPISSDLDSPDIKRVRPLKRQRIIHSSPDQQITVSAHSFYGKNISSKELAPKSRLHSKEENSPLASRPFSLIDRVIGGCNTQKNQIKSLKNSKTTVNVLKKNVRAPITPPTSISSDDADNPIKPIDLTNSNPTYYSHNKVKVTDQEKRITFISQTKNRAKQAQSLKNNSENKKHTNKLTQTYIATTSSKLDTGRKISIRKGGDSDDYDESIASGASDDDNDTNLELLREALNFLNDASISELVDTVAISENQAKTIKSMRPFESINDARSRLFREKGVSANIIKSYMECTRMYETVDVLISKCEDIGKDIARIVESWGASTTGNDGIDLVKADIMDSTFLRRQPPNMSDDVQLKGYQLLGVNWLSLLYSKGLSCILADEMGLGKTCQVIALFAHLATLGSLGPHLVVVPSSTIENWLREFARFCPTLVVQAYYGSQKDREFLRQDIRETKGEWNVLVTTYSLATGAHDDRSFLRKFAFQVCCFDEGHMLKNCLSQRYKYLMSLNARFRLLLTGTPLQNNLQELVSLLTFILPQVFEESTESLNTIFKVKGSAELSHVSKKRIERAKAMMTPFLLRRKKVQVLTDIPAKHNHVVYCEMTAEQKQIYDDHERKSRKAMMEGNMAKENQKKKKVMLSSGTNHILMSLRQTANHPMLFRRLYTDDMLHKMSREILKETVYADANPDIIYEDMEVMCDYELHRLCKQFSYSLGNYALKSSEWMRAGKIEQLQKILPGMVERGDRILLFSQFTRTLDILESVLDTMGYKYCRMDGSTKVEERQPLLDKFTQDTTIPIFLLSTRAGGFGINLTAANTVVLYDIDFNPHNDKQAEDRAHRVGQTRQVNVYKFVTRGTIEEYIMRLATSKLSLDQRISDDPNQDGRQLEASVFEMLKKKWQEEEGRG